MENAVDALKIAFAVMVFTMALTLAISTFSQARETSEAVLFMNDKTNYYSWEDDSNYYEVNGTGDIVYKSERIVGIEAIIPTLYRYYKENYTVIFDGMDTDFYIYTTKKDSRDNDKWIIGSAGDKVREFDLNKEIQANCPWVGTVSDIKKNLDLFLKGTSGLLDSDKSFGNANRKVEYNQGFINECANATFLEQLGEYATDRNYGMKRNSSGQKVVVVNGVEYEYNETTGTVNGQKLSEFLEGQGVIINTATTKIDDESGEIIELAKPTVKRVIKYTLINNP